VLKQTNASSPFQLDSEIKLVSNTIIDKTLKRVASSLTGLSYLDKLYQQLPPTDKPEDFCGLALDTLNIRYQALGFVHPRLRTALLARELINKQSTQIDFTVGRPIPYKKLSRFTDNDSLTRYLKMQTDLLTRSRIETNLVDNKAPNLEPIESPCSTNVLQAEVDQLPPNHRLICANPLQVYYAAAKEIPWITREIGRLREMTFRQAGEGTGKSIDLDIYDDYYLHLFIWDKANRCVVGAYRLGLADDILKRLDKKGLYTQSLFKYKTQLIEHLNPAIELGRSFVRPEGIGQIYGKRACQSLFEPAPTREQGLLPRRPGTCRLKMEPGHAYGS
jgi:hypothetical protein